MLFLLSVYPVVHCGTAGRNHPDLLSYPLIPTAAIVLFEVGGGVVAEVRGPIYIANGAFSLYINQYTLNSIV